MKIGLRNSEIRMLRIENIDFEDRTFQVLDSKKYELFPLPLDILTLQLIKDLIGKRQEGYVFTHQGSWTHVKADQPLSRVEIWQIIHDIAEKAGVKRFSPRLLRHYFAAHWIYVEKKNVVTLQGLMRHSDLSVTFFYTRRLTFFEDWQREYDGVKNGPFQEFEKESNPVSIEDSVCKNCSNLSICKFAPLPSCVSRCRLFLDITKTITI
jgi:integrase